MDRNLDLGAQRFNHRHHRVGHLFQGRFKGILVERESHLLELCRYIVLNPVRARMVAEPVDWEWSNYRATAGSIDAPPWLEVDWTLTQFHETDPEIAPNLYEHFVASGLNHDDPWTDLRGQIYLGSENFCRRLAQRIGRRSHTHEYPRRQRRPVRPSLDQIVDMKQHRRSPTLGRFYD